MFRHLLASRVSRALSIALVAGQALTAIPVIAAPPAPAAPPPIVLASPPPLPQVTVNRTVPTVTAPPSVPQFSAAPTVEEIFRARVFPEPLVPVGGEPSAGENLVLAQALLAFHRSGGTAWESTLGPFLLAQPQSPWRASLLANLGVVQLQAHAYSRALASFNEAWALAKDVTDARGRAVADGAVAEWLTLAASFGLIEQVETRLSEIVERAIGGSAGPKIAAAREATALTKRHPERTLPCGPAALLALLAERGAPLPAFLSAYRATTAGTSLGELEALAAQAGLGLQMAFREDATRIPVPAVLHLKVGHYVAVVERENDRYRVIDRTRGEAFWVSGDTLFNEVSGYALLAPDASREGWRAVAPDEARDIRGRGPMCLDGSQGNPPCGKCCKPPCGGSPGMASYQLEPTSTSLRLFDTPVGYTPARGPAVSLTLGYHQRDALQPQIFTSSNLGPKWTFEWVRFVQEVPTDAFGVTPPHVWVTLPPGGREVFSQPDAQGVYPAHWNTRAVLLRVTSSPVRYERRLADGNVEVYTLSDGAPAGQRRVMLTQLTDPQGQSLQFTWDSQTRLLSLTDAIGQVTTFAYEHATDPLKITKVTDPFGRVATFTYNAAGQLASITDVIGLTSRFAYGPDDFVTTLTTPYGVTTFRHEPNTSTDRFIEATDALGGTEHLEFQWETPSLAASAPAADVPAGFTAWNWNLDHYNSFYWSKRAWAAGAGDLTKAEVTHWLVKPEWAGWQKYSYVPHSVKKSLEGRVWYAYPGQLPGNEDELGWLSKPSRVGRVLDDGTSQIYETTYNTQGSVLTKTDPLGRQTSYTYASNGVDLLEVRQTTGGINDLLATYASYNTQHQPQSVTDAAGQSTTMTYNAAGQVLTVTNAKNETTTSTYDTDGRLTTVTGPLAGAMSSYTYDGYGRIRTVTDSDGYVLTKDYDVFDRLWRVTYPDASYEETIYDRLDVSTRRDRAGRITRYYYDPLQRLVSTRDPAGRVVAQEWCTCGALDALVDANGHRTRWERDLQGRVTREVRADNSTSTIYTYGAASGRLATVTDPKGQVTTYTYALDNAVLSTAYTNAAIATPTVSYTYDAQYARVATMTDGTGLTTYTYHPAGVLGGGRVASVDGPLTDDTITYAYDQLGRVTTRAINGAANTVTWAFDALGRVTSEVNVLGTFTYTYEGVSGRIYTLTYPSAQTSAYSYFDNAGDRRLQTIHHKYPGGATLSRFDYTYDPIGNILTWRQQADATAVLWSYGYDAADQLTWAVQKTTEPVPTVLKTYMYAYDAAGNRTSEQIDDQVTGASYDILNRLVSQQPAGAIAVEGMVSEPASVTVQGKPVVAAAGGNFATTTPVISGTNTLTLTATDASGNAASNQYEVDGTGGDRTFTYDANGNLTADGTRTFEWDAADRLLSVTEGSDRFELQYDGLGRRSRLIRKTVGTTVSDVSLIWCDLQVCEERDAAGTVHRRRMARGEQVDGTTQLWALDHLGSIRAVMAGGQVSGTYESDPFGRPSAAYGDVPAFYASFEGFAADLWLAPFRVYNPDTGRWLSEDPSGLHSGPNLYRYVENQPLVRIDPLGLWSVGAEGGVSGSIGGMVGIGGGSCGVGAIGATQGQLCAFVQCCLRLGFGYFAGIGANVALAVNNSAPQSGWSCSIGVAGEAGAGPSTGGGVSMSSSSIGASAGWRPGVGYGFWAGLEVCCSKLKCACK